MTCVSKSHFLGITLMALVHSQDYSNFTQKLSKLLNLFLINSVHQALGEKYTRKCVKSITFTKNSKKRLFSHLHYISLVQLQRANQIICAQISINPEEEDIIKCSSRLQQDEEYKGSYRKYKDFCQIPFQIFCD